MNDESMLPGSPRFGHEGAVIWLTGLSASLQPQLRLETAGNPWRRAWQRCWAMCWKKYRDRSRPIKRNHVGSPVERATFRGANQRLKRSTNAYWVAAVLVSSLLRSLD